MILSSSSISSSSMRSCVILSSSSMILSSSSMSSSSMRSCVILSSSSMSRAVV